MSGTAITCCLCNGEFDERDLRGSWLDRRCPLCAGRLSEEAYDAAAAEVIARHRPQLGRRGARALENLALARYHVSEWFRLACAGQGSTAADKGLFGLKPGYDAATGAFQLIPADDDRSPDGGWGASAEYFVFDAIRRDLIDASSPLAGARLLPSLVFPWLPGQKPKQWGAKHRAETDCIVLCRSCAVIIEVKRRNHHIRVSADGAHVRERTEGGSFRSASEVFEQVDRGADSFAERQDLYPENRIFKLVVFVDPISFERAESRKKPRATDAAGWNLDARLSVSWMCSGGEAPFVEELRQLASSLDPIVGKRTMNSLAKRVFEQFGNTRDRRCGRIISAHRPEAGAKLRRTSAFLDAVERACASERSPLHDAHLLRNLVCEVQVGKRGGQERLKRVDVPGLLLTRTHAVFIDVKRWPVHVNTHVPFATVYTGDQADGAKRVDDEIRHDWDLDAIHYRNRSGSLTLLNYIAKSMPETDAYRERNRVTTLHVFIDPATFHSDSDDFRQKTFIGYWRGREENAIGALERYVAAAEPIMSQRALDKLTNSLINGT